jgi:hypothetical protein
MDRHADRSVSNEAWGRAGRGFAFAALLLALVSGCVGTGEFMTDVAAAGHSAPVTKVVAVWHNQVIAGVDPVNHGERLCGLAGRVYLFGEDLATNPLADGRLVVELYAMLPEQPQGPPVRQGQWVIERTTLNAQCLKKDPFGQGYTLNLPWPAYRPDITRLEIRTCYEPAKGMPVYEQSFVMLNNGPAPVPVCANRMETGDGRLISTQTRPPQQPQPVPPGGAMPPPAQPPYQAQVPQAAGVQPAAFPAPGQQPGAPSLYPVQPASGVPQQPVQSFQPAQPFPGSYHR